jgi:hypothetical protein
MAAVARAGLETAIVTGAGTGTWMLERDSGVWNELQPGSYVFMDADYGRNVRADTEIAFEQSLFVIATVTSVPTPARAVCDAGLKAFAFDSGPPLVGGDVSPALVAVWISAWRIDRVVVPICVECLTDLSRLLPVLARRHPHDRLAVLSSTQDTVIRAFLGYLDGAAFEAAIGRLEAAIDPVPGARYFVVAGTSHTMLPAPAGFAASGVELRAWLGQQLAADPAWTSARP